MKEHLLIKIILPVKSTQNIHDKYGNVASAKNISANIKSKSTTQKVSSKATPPETLAMPATLDYNIVEDMKNLAQIY